MKGLMVKDLLLLKNQAKTLLLLVACGMVMSLSFDPQIVIIYLTIIGGMVAIGTLSYDEADNGYSYLMTLPVTRRTYVKEKYLFTLLWTACCALIGTALCAAVGLISKKAVEADVLLLTGPGALLGISLIASLMIPFRLKYGSEKGRIVLYAVMMLFAVGVILLKNLGITETPEWIKGLSRPAAVIALSVFCCLIFLISEQISERIMVQKEF